MSYSSSKRYTQHQQQIFRYVLFMLSVSALAVCAGITTMFLSSKVAYAVQHTHKDITALERELAVLESEYFVATKDITPETQRTSMVAYSPSSSSLRYAQVGGNVYSFATTNR